MRRGFTLIELLVVIAIIAVLLGILLPHLAGARDAARTTRCLANVRSVGQALAIYAEDFKEKMPHWSAWQTFGGDGASNEDTAGEGWAELLIEHSGGEVVAGTGGADGKAIGGVSGALVCQARVDPKLPVAMFLQSRYTAILNQSRFYSSLSLAQVQMSQQFVMTGEGTNPTLYAAPFGTGHAVPNADPDDARWQAVFYPGETRPHGARGGGKSEESSDVRARGTGVSNLAMLDGSAATFGKYVSGRMTWSGTEMKGWGEVGR